MNSKIISSAEHQQNWAKAAREARFGGMNSFQGFFDKSKDINESIARGHWDLTLHILTPKVREYLHNPKEKIALEIGYGGGRVFNAACSYFKQVIGIDIHDEQETVETFLKSQGKNNFRLIKTSGISIDVSSESIDFIYSFIVLQHLSSIDAFICYVKETYRSLRPGGVAQLYFGKYSQLNPLDQLRYFIQGYKEIPPDVWRQSLVIRVSKVRRWCEDSGFKVLETGTSYKIRRVPDGCLEPGGGQNYITLLKK